MKEMGLYEWVAYVIVLVGAVNWGLIGLFNLNIVSAIFGAGFFSRLLYIVVGLAAGYLIYFYIKHRN